MMKVFVTGVNGQLGQEMAAILTRKGHTVISSDKDSMDLSQPENIENFFTQFPDAIVHCAAFTAVDQSGRRRTTVYERQLPLDVKIVRRGTKSGHSLCVYFHRLRV